MRFLLYLRLTYLTAGTLLAFFWMVVILGHRRQRNFERIFFFLCLALVSFFGCSLLWVNAQLFYGEVPAGLRDFAWTFLCLGLWLVPALITHLHVEYASLRALIRSVLVKRVWVACGYLPALLLAPKLATTLRPWNGADFEHPSRALGAGYQVWLTASLASAAWWQWRFASTAPDQEQRRFHNIIEFIVSVICVLLVALMILPQGNASGATMWISALLLILALVPFGILIGNVQRFNFLQIGRQRNLIYAVFVTFLALLYLSLVRRGSLWLEDYLPPEATAALLLFLPVVFFEPLQRIMRRLLQQTAQKELDHAHKLIGPINEAARLGDVSKLSAFSEKWIAEELQLAEAKIEMGKNGAGSLRGARSSPDVFEIRRGSEQLGTLRVKPYGAMISGETYAALELLSEQLPAAYDLCRSIGEKLQLERELAERERLALVGQMAASISHNLKNPLGSIKTILQVQLENPELPATMRQETQMVLDEIGRLSGKLNQLLQFSRPGLRGGSNASCCDLGEATEQVVNVFRHEAEAKGVVLEFRRGQGSSMVAAGAEAVNDILSNILLNAIEAVERRGHVRVTLERKEEFFQVDIVDDGPGIPATLLEKIQRPFFTTKARGTGLGLAIVQRRLEEVEGKMEVLSPVENGRGTRFRIGLRLAPIAPGAQVSK